MSIKFSDKTGKIAIAGHVGCGHAHSLNKQVQDDSCGLSVVLELFQRATGLSLKIKDISFDKDTINIFLENGGVGSAKARRGITLQEKNIIKKMIGKEAKNTHTLIMEYFGRVYGQGVLEVPVATQTAIANAALDGFKKNYPGEFHLVEESIEGNCGKILGAVLDINGKPVSVLGTVNATIGGIGPVEDQEGNSIIGEKGRVIRELGMDKIPTIVLEAMIYSNFSHGLKENTYFIRGDREDDNIVVVEAVVNAAKRCGIPVKYHETTMKRTKNALRENTKKVAKDIISLGERLKNAETSKEKVEIVSELAIKVSQDCGGVTFMSNDLHEEIGGPGMLKKLGALINLVVSEDYIVDNPIPYLTDDELQRYTELVLESIDEIWKVLDKANEIIERG